MLHIAFYIKYINDNFFDFLKIKKYMNHFKFKWS